MQSPDTSEDTAKPRRPSTSCTNFAGAVSSAFVQIGHARSFLTYAGKKWDKTEDDLAYFRDERQFRNVHLVEQERDGFGFEMARLLTFSTYQCELYAALRRSSDPVLAGVAAAVAPFIPGWLGIQGEEARVLSRCFAIAGCGSHASPT